MSRHTTFGIGGPADLFLVASSVSELCTAVRLAYEHHVPYFVLGSGANVLVADKGIRGLVIQNQCAAVSIALDPDAQTSRAGSPLGEATGPVEGGQTGSGSAEPGAAWLVRAESGALLRDVARQAIARGLAGLEWAVDIPGTIGGAVVGNAGAFGGYISDNLRRARVLTLDGGNSSASEPCGHWWSKDDLKLGYRTSVLKEQKELVRYPPVILEAVFALRADDRAALRERAQQYTRRRLETQPTGPSAGSVFKRSAQYPAGFLIENAGLKDTRIGGAVISPQHANFIVNVGGASAQDVRALIQLVRERVYAQFKIMLDLEVELVGDW